MVEKDQYINQLKTDLDCISEENNALKEEGESLKLENEKLEKLKNSILNSFEDKEGISFVNTSTSKNNSKYKISAPNNKFNSYTKSNLSLNNDHTINSSNSNYMSKSGFYNNNRKIDNPDRNKNLPWSNSNPRNCNTPTLKDNPTKSEKNIDLLLDRLNESINRRLYSEQGNSNLEDNKNAYSFSNKNNATNRNLVGNDLLSKKSLGNPYKSESNSKQFDNIHERINHIKGKGFSSNTNKQTSSNTNSNKLLGPDENQEKPYCNQSTNSNFSNFKNYKEEISKIHSRSGNKSKSHQYNLTSTFFSDCKLHLKMYEYSELVDILKNFNNNNISQSEAFNRIEVILKPYNRLLLDFKEIFGSH